MAFKLTKAEKTQKAELATKLEEAKDKLLAEIASYNEKLAELGEPVQAAVEAYNDAVQAAKNFADDIASSRQDEFDEKSERWQESDNGCNAQEFINAWEGVDDSEAEVELPEEIAEPDLDVSEEFSELPDEV